MEILQIFDGIEDQIFANSAFCVEEQCWWSFVGIVFFNASCLGHFLSSISWNINYFVDAVLEIYLLLVTPRMPILIFLRGVLKFTACHCFTFPRIVTCETPSYN